MNVGNNNTLPNYIDARNVKALRVAMIKNNTRLKMSFIPYQIIFDGKLWYAWYNEPIAGALEAALKEDS